MTDRRGEFSQKVDQAQQAVGWRPVAKILLLGLVVTGCFLLMKSTPLGEMWGDEDSRQNLLDHIQVWRENMQDSMGHWLPLLYVFAGIILIAAGVPRIWYSFLGGALFGFLMGTVWGYMAAVVGSILCFWFARHLGREWVRNKFGRKFEGIERRLRQEGFPIMLLIRICPLGNNFATNCLAGTSSMRARSFFYATIIGHLPLSVFFAMWGSGAIKGESHQTLIGIVGAVLFILGFVVYFRKSKLAREIALEFRGGNVASKPEPPTANK
ncbi:TVP38/TMEM64 family protein [bacterium]|nr:TVP38/TMEM64 family protein [bacterium]